MALRSLRRTWQPFRNFCTPHTPVKEKPRRILTFAKWSGGVLGLCGAGSLVYYSFLDEEEKRKTLISVGGIRRFIRTLRIGLMITGDYWWSLRNLDENSEDYNITLKAVHQRSADNILYGCLKNGGIYIKLGQGLVSLNHILPKEYLETLKKLQDQCLTRKEDEVRQIFLDEFNESENSLFKHFDPNPIAAASLAQVFRATTKDGEDVAVKVQYFDLRDRFNGDIMTVKLLLTISALIHPSYNFKWVVNEMAETLAQELDFLNEADNSERCARELSKFEYAYVPKVRRDLTTKRILTTEFIDGIKVSDVVSLKKKGLSLKDIDVKLFKIFSEQIFHTGFVHADPHPGNILIRKSKNNDAEIVLLDHGLYQYVPSNVRQALCNVWKSIVLHDYEGMKSHSKELGVDDGFLFAEILTQRPLKLHNYDLKLSLSESDMQYMTDMAREKFDSIIVTLKQMPSNVLLVIRNINTIRAIAKEHGDPVDRYRLMARSATQGAFTCENATILQNVKGYRQRMLFEFRLFTDAFKYWLWQTVYRILFMLGRAPDLKAIAKEKGIG